MSTTSSLLSQTSPEIAKTLDNEHTWVFDVLQLEKMSQKRSALFENSFKDDLDESDCIINEICGLHTCFLEVLKNLFLILC